MKHWRKWIVGLALVPWFLYVPVALAHPHKPPQKTSSVRLMARPNMAIIPETRVYYVRDEADFDLYQFGDSWYVVEDGAWYRARTWRGPFIAIRTSSVPREILTIPPGYRRGWVAPAALTAPESRTRRPLRAGEPNRGAIVPFKAAPRMAIIPETEVYYSRDESRYDLYRYGNRWYLVEDGNWFRAPSWRGPFVSIRTRDVPRAVLTVPAGYRRSWAPHGS